MRSKKLTLALNLIVVLVLALGLVLPCLFVDTASDVAYAAASTANSAADWESVYNGNYYDGISENSTGTALRSQLHDLITRTHTTKTVYNGSSSLALNNVWPKTDVDPATGKMIWFYSGTLRNGFNGTSNREHVWPKNSGKAFPAESGPAVCNSAKLRKRLRTLQRKTAKPNTAITICTEWTHCATNRADIFIPPRAFEDKPRVF